MRLSPETTARRPIVLLTAAASFALGIAPFASGQNAGGEAGIAPSAGDFAGGTSDGTAVRPTAAEVIDQATSLLERGQPVKAEALLRLLSEPSFAVGMSDAEAGAYFRLLRRARAAVSEADPIDVRLERAELALAESKLSSAEEHAARVLETQGASEEQESRAQAIRESIEAARNAIEQRADALLADAESAFQAGDYAAAKTALVRLERSGVEFGDAETDRAADLSARITDIEVATGRSISPDTLTLGLLEPDRLSKDWIVGVSASSQPEEPDQDGAEPEATAQEQPEGEQAADEAPREDPVQQALRLEAQRLLTEADAAFDASRFAEARRKYRQLLQPGLRGTLGQAEIDRVEQRLEEAQLELRGPGDLLGEEIQERELARQQVLAEFENQIQQANEALEQGDFETARQAAAGARLSLAQGRQVLGQAEFAELESRVESLQNRITTAEERRETRLAEERAREIAQARREAEREQQSQRQQEIRELLNRIFDLQQQMEYERALEEVERLLFIDPNNTAGLMLRDVFRDTLLFRRHEEAKREIDRRVAEASVSNFEAAVPPEGLIDYPEDWVEISRRRGDPLQYTESAVNRAVLATLEQERLPVDFQEVPLENVLTFLSTFANLELDVDWQSLDAIGVNRQDTITLQLTNVPLQVALERTLDKVSDPDLAADWAVRDGVLTVASEDALRRNTVLELYDIRDLLIEIPDYEEAPEFDLDSIFSQGGEGGGGGGQSPFQTQDQDPERQTREELIQRIVDIIQNNVDQNGWQAFGGQTGTIEEFNGSLIITNTPKNHRAITGLLSRLREVRNLQINIEARFLSVNEDFFEQIGFDIDLFFGGDSEIVQTAQAVDPSVSLDDFFAETDEGERATRACRQRQRRGRVRRGRQRHDHARRNHRAAAARAERDE